MISARFPHRHRGWALTAVPVVLLAVVATACGGGSSRAATSSTTTTPQGAGTAGAQFTQCLESHGVPASAASSGIFGRRRQPGAGQPGATQPGTTQPGSPSSTTGPRPTVPAQYQAAFQACRNVLPNRAGGFNTPAFAAYRNCLQIHGVTLPSRPSTPTSTPGTSTSGAPAGSSAQSSPAFRAAQQACASLLPSRSTTSTTTIAPAA